MRRTEPSSLVTVNDIVLIDVTLTVMRGIGKDICNIVYDNNGNITKGRQRMEFGG